MAVYISSKSSYYVMYKSHKVKKKKRNLPSITETTLPSFVSHIPLSRHCSSQWEDLSNRGGAVNPEIIMQDCGLATDKQALLSPVFHLLNHLFGHIKTPFTHADHLVHQESIR